MNIVIVGHVDHGKSTIIGRLLADTGALPKGKLEQVREKCKRNAKPFEYAFLLDALKDEQAQGITIDCARCFFKTDKRRYMIVDAPGHIEFLKNMVTGAATAEAALLVIDANEGVMENSKRHAYMLSMLGIKQVTVLVNKMDLVAYNQQVYHSIVNEYIVFLEGIGISAFSFIPVSGMNGDNILALSKNMLWYDGQTVLQTLDGFVSDKPPEDQPFRMSVQDIYKFTNNGDDRRIIAGTVETGRVAVGAEVVFYPSGKTSKIASIEAFNAPKQTCVTSGFATGFTLQEQLYVKKGELMVVTNQEKPKTTSRFKANIFWLGNAPLQKHKKYILKLLSAKVLVEIDQVISVLDASSMTREQKQEVSKYEAAQCILKTDKAIAFDEAGEILQTSRFVLVDDYEIAGGGLIQQALEDEQSWVREKVQTRNYKWIKSGITKEQRAERYKQKAALVLITGKKEAARKELARALEKNLFEQQKFVYYIGMGSIVYGLNADIQSQQALKQEHIRRLAETANILLDAGVILVVTAVELSQSDIELIHMAVNTECIYTIWLGDKTTTDIECDLIISDKPVEQKAVNDIKALLKQKEII